MKFAIIENNIVVNVIEAPEDFVLEGVDLVPSDGAGIGYSFENGVFVAPPTNPMPDEYPTEVIIQDLQTGQPVKVVVKNGEVFVGGLDETPS